jgi:subtilisin family serine protease
VRPIFTDTARQPAASADELASAIIDCVLAGSRVLNISAALAGLSPTGTQGLEGALDHARDAGVVVLVAAGNRGLVGGSPLTRHPWVIPVVGFDATGVPLPGSDVSASTGRRGLGALGQDVLGLTPGGGLTTASGTSVATPFVAGAAALIWSEVPQATGAAVRYALTHATSRRRQGVVPPLLDAWRAFSILRQAR